MRVCSPLFVLVLMVSAPIVFASGSAATPASFPERPRAVLDVPAFSDHDVATLESTLDALLAAEPASADWGRGAETTLWDFVRQLQGGRLSAIQQSQVDAHLRAIETAHASDAAVLRRARAMMDTLTVGKTAPDIVGKDFDGQEFRLSDYRGKVVVLVFSAEWCGICRTEFPYERLMQDLYGNWPFAIVGVDTGPSLDAAKTAKAAERLTFRSWWDPAVGESDGAIASAWNVLGFPAIYVLDARGVVRFVDLRDEDLLKGVKQLLSEQQDLQLAAKLPDVRR